MCDGQVARAAQKFERDALADRIAAVLRGRKKVGVEQRIQQRRIQERAFAGRSRLHDELSREPGKPYPSLRWNSANGPTVG